MPKNPSHPPAPLTSPKIKRLAGEALKHPSTMSAEELRELAGSVLAHIEPRKKPKK